MPLHLIDFYGDGPQLFVLRRDRFELSELIRCVIIVSLTIGTRPDYDAGLWCDEALRGGGATFPIVILLLNNETFTSIALAVVLPGAIISKPCNHRILAAIPLINVSLELLLHFIKEAHYMVEIWLDLLFEILCSVFF